MNCLVFGPLPNAERYRICASAAAEDRAPAPAEDVPKPDPSNPYSTTSNKNTQNPFFSGKPIFG